MQTDTVVLSAKFPCYSIPVPPGKYKGFFRFAQGHFTFEQSRYINLCGGFLLKDRGMVVIGLPMRFIPTNNRWTFSSTSSTFLSLCPGLLGEGWKIELEFFDEVPREGSKEPPLKWSDFPGEVEIGFSFVEE